MLLSAGCSTDGYSKGGYQGFDTEDYFPQFESTAHLCGMAYPVPVYSYNMAYLPGISSEAELAAHEAVLADIDKTSGGKTVWRAEKSTL